MSGYLKHLETCPDRSTTLWVEKKREDLERQYVVPVTDASTPVFPEPEELWEVEPTTTPKPREPPVPPVFRQVRGLSSAERRVYYHPLFVNQVDYRPPKQPNENVSSPCSNQSNHAQAEATMPRGAEAASPKTLLHSGDWPCCAQACQDKTDHSQTRKTGVQVVAQTADRQPLSTEAPHLCNSKASQTCSTEPSETRGIQSSQTRRTQARWPHCTQPNQTRGLQDTQTRGTKPRQKRGTQDKQPQCAQPSQTLGTQPSQTCGTRARKPREAQAQAGHQRAVHAAQGSQRLGVQASSIPERTWADLFH
ncbi:hypothetical protein MTO96_043966 [Rhipicephalus appendiculatus]